MSDLPAYVARVPVVSALFARELSHRARDGRAIDFAKGWWHPPVTPRAVFESELRQIEHALQLAPIVSITDHDDITAGLELQAVYASSRSPISFEWTVPYRRGFFHIGVHNLPSASSREWFERLARQTAAGDDRRLPAVFDALSECRDTLLVLNHPKWDLARVGAAEHDASLDRFLTRFRRYLHAIEVNGYRSRDENEAACALARAAAMPIISGGDRHACAPNAVLNLTNARSFAEFAEEVRAGVSHVLIMPEYRDHLVVRKLAAAADVLRRYPSYPAGRQEWTDRVSCEWEGAVRPLSYHWPDGGPLWVRSTVRAFRMVTSRVGLPVVHAALRRLDGGASSSEVVPVPSPGAFAPELQQLN